MNEQKVESVNASPIEVEIHIKGGTLGQRLFAQAVLIPEIEQALNCVLEPYVKSGIVA